jgi:hypothetical protein
MLFTSIHPGFPLATSGSKHRVSEDPRRVENRVGAGPQLMKSRTARSVRLGNTQVSLREVLSLEQQGFPRHLGKGVGKTVLVVGPSRMPALTEIGERLPRNVLGITY